MAAAPGHNLPDSDTGRPRSRCHSLLDQPQDALAVTVAIDVPVLDENTALWLRNDGPAEFTDGDGALVISISYLIIPATGVVPV